MKLFFASFLFVVLGCAHSDSRTQESAELAHFTQSTDWLELVEGKEAIEWVKGENERTQKKLESDPRFKTFQSQFYEILTAKDRIPSVWLKGEFAYNFWQDQKHVRGILRRSSIRNFLSGRESWSTVLDLDELSKIEKENWVWSGLQCLPDKSTRCLVSLSRGGKDAAVIREFDLNMAEFVANGFVLPEAKSVVDWIDADTLFVGTDWGTGSLSSSGYPRQVRIWKRGQNYKEAKLLFEARESDLSATGSVLNRANEKQLLVIRELDFYRKEFFWTDKSFGQLRPLALPESIEVLGLFKGLLLVKTREPWSFQSLSGPLSFTEGEVIALNFDHWLMTGKWERAESLFKANNKQALDRIAFTKDRVLMTYLDQVQSQMVTLKYADGLWTRAIQTFPIGINVSFAGTDDFRDDFFIRVEGFLSPTELKYFENSESAPKTARTLPPRFSTRGLEVVQNWATSKDGTQVPYFIVGPAENRGPLPTIVYGYGGFEISSLPYYSGGVGKVWLEAGNRYVVANIRGGGEFGPRWHNEGMLEYKQNVFDDFIAVSEDLVRRGYATKKMLGAIGGSNGGLLMGAMLTQRPDLFKAIDCQVPLLDMMNYNKWLAGASWVGEYGDPQDPKARGYLLKYSPLHNFLVGREYPEPLFVTSTKDDRVHPAHARKMAYLMQSTKHPFLYYENIEGGHGGAANLIQRAYKAALEYVYFYQKLKD